MPDPAAVVSRTSQAVALARAELARPHSPDGDPGAQRKLCAGMRPAAVPARFNLPARTAFFDGAVLGAVRAGTPQVVICGAGYDDRALRFRTPGATFYELDHPATQRDKADRLRHLGVTNGPVLVPADFARDDVATVLASAGHDPARPTLFCCEGLLVYLDRATHLTLLGGLAGRAAPTSVLAASLSVHRPGADSAEVAAIANSRRRNGTTEPWLTILPAPEYLALIEESGWHPTESTDPATLDKAATPGRGLLISAQPAG